MHSQSIALKMQTALHDKHKDKFAGLINTDRTDNGVSAIEMKAIPEVKGQYQENPDLTGIVPEISP